MGLLGDADACARVALKVTGLDATIRVLPGTIKLFTKAELHLDAPRLSVGEPNWCTREREPEPNQKGTDQRAN